LENTPITIQASFAFSLLKVGIHYEK